MFNIKYLQSLLSIDSLLFQWTGFRLLQAEQRAMGNLDAMSNSDEIIVSRYCIPGGLGVYDFGN